MGRVVIDYGRDYADTVTEIAQNPIPGLIRTSADLAVIPEPAWLIRDLLAEGSMAWLAGAPGAYKSFMAIDWACALSLGVNTCGGRRTQPTNVLYMACEGAAGLWRRVEAWQRSTGLTANVAWLPAAVQIGSVEWAWLTETCLDRNIGLLVIDTYSRATLGLDEIDGREQGRMVKHLDTFREVTGAAVLGVHHHSAAGKTLRGHTSLEGAADTVITLTKDNDVVTMACAKQKDAEQFAPEYYRASLTARSLVLVPCEEPAVTPKRSTK